MDATNAISDDADVVFALTGADLNHQEFLGNMMTNITRGKVGGEKVVRVGEVEVPRIKEADSVRNTILGDGI